MSEHFSTAAKILIARIESHPEEFRQFNNKWRDIVSALSVRTSGDSSSLPALTDEEVEAINDKLREHIWRPELDDLVMGRVLDPQKEEREARTEQRLDAYQLSQGKRVISSGGGWTDPRLAQNNVVQPSGVYEIAATQSSGTSIMSVIKNGLGIK
jgi:hypothetical protein